MFPAGVLLADTGPTGEECFSWTYTLVVKQTYPSRMAVVKNVLGKWVTITTPWEPPDWPRPEEFNSAWRMAANANITSVTRQADDAQPLAPGEHTYAWTVNFSSLQPDPGPPFNLYATDATDPSRQPILGGDPPPTWLTWPNVYYSYTDTGGTFGSGAVVQKPLDVVGTSTKVANWGLMIFSTGIDRNPDNPSGTWDKAQQGRADDRHVRQGRRYEHRKRDGPGRQHARQQRHQRVRQHPHQRRARPRGRRGRHRQRGDDPAVRRPGHQDGYGPRGRRRPEVHPAAGPQVRLPPPIRLDPGHRRSLQRREPGRV